MATIAAEVIKFRFGTVVVASDGEAGTVSHVVVQPGTQAFMAVGVKLPGGTTATVSLDRVIDATSEAVHVTVTREALLQTLVKTTIQGSLLSNKTNVTNAGKSLGTLTQVSVTVATAAIRTIGIRQGLSGEIIIAGKQITSMSDDGRTIDTVGQTLPYIADIDLYDEVHSRLGSYPRLHIDIRAVNIRVIDGELWITGHVSSTLNRRIIADLLVGTKGLTIVDNALVSDVELAVKIAQALSKDSRTHGQHIGVYPTLGKVYLRGLTSTTEASQAAIQIAQATAGTASVIGELAVSNAQFIPLLAPVTGNEDVIPGGA